MALTIGDRFSPAVAPEKAECRQRCIATVNTQKHPIWGEGLRVLSLPGPVPYTENLLLQTHRLSEFDLVERDPDALEALNRSLATTFPNVGDKATVHAFELGRFIKRTEKRYHVAFLDMMGGWCQSYIQMFENLVPKMDPGGLIFLTYDKDFRFKLGERHEIAYAADDLPQHLPLELLWEHEYTDSGRILMRTMAFKVTGNVPKERSVQKTRPLPIHEYERLFKAGYRQILDVYPEVSPRAVASLITQIKKAHPEVVGVSAYKRREGESDKTRGTTTRVLLFSPAELAKIDEFYRVKTGETLPVSGKKPAKTIATAGAAVIEEAFAPTPQAPEVIELPPVTEPAQAQSLLDAIKQRDPEIYKIAVAVVAAFALLSPQP